MTRGGWRGGGRPKTVGGTDKVTVELKPHQIEELKAFAKSRQVSVSSVVRALVEQGLPVLEAHGWHGEFEDVES